MANQMLHIRVDEKTYNQIVNIAKKEDRSQADVTRELLKEGLSVKVSEENVNLMAKVIREQLEIVIKPHIERLAALESKTGHMAAASAFLNTQALMDIVPVERRKDVKVMYENARKKAVAYMKTRTSEGEEL